MNYLAHHSIEHTINTQVILFALLVLVMAAIAVAFLVKGRE